MSSATNRKINQKYLFITSQSMYERVSSITFCVPLRHPGNHPPPSFHFPRRYWPGFDERPSIQPTYLCLSFSVAGLSASVLRSMRRIKGQFVMPFHFIRSFIVCTHFAHFPAAMILLFVPNSERPINCSILRQNPLHIAYYLLITQTLLHIKYIIYNGLVFVIR